jgi:hypothetical protein
MKILITLSSAGQNTGPFNIYSNIDNYTTAFAVNLSREILLAGYITNNAPMGTTYVRVKSNTSCKNYVDIHVLSQNGTTTTTTTVPGNTTTTTSSTTIAPGTTTTTTTLPPTTTTTTTVEPLPGVGVDFVYTLI